MKNFTTEMKIGFFTIFSFLAIGYMFFVLNPSRFSGDKFKAYYTVVQNASGIIENTNVLTNGVNIGKVNTIRLDDNGHTRIDFQVKSYVKIPRGSKTAIKEKGLLGDVYLEIVRSENYSDLIEEGSALAALDDPMGIGDLTALAGSVGKDVKKVTVKLANTFGTDEGEVALKDILFDLRDSISLIKKSLVTNSDNIDRITENIKEISSNLVHVSKTAKTLFDFEDKESMKGVFDSLKEISKNIEQASHSIMNVSQRIDSGEGTLGKLINDDKVVQDIEEGLSSINEMIAPAKRLSLNLDYHGEYRFDQQNQHYVNLTVRTRPDLFYTVGITNTYQTQVYSELEIDGSNSDLAKELSRPHGSSKYLVQRQEALRFNLQVGKRWHDLELRIGLFESTGGVAADYYFFRDILKLGVEAYAWNMKDDSNFIKRKVALFKAYVSLNFFSNLYIVGGINDFTQKGIWSSGKTPFYIGAGFNFTDKDLSGVFGAASLAR